MDETEFRGVQGETRSAAFVFVSRTIRSNAIDGVAAEWVARFAQVNSDLMRSSGQGLAED